VKMYRIISVIIFVMLFVVSAVAQYTEVADIAAARALSDSTPVKILGKVKVAAYGQIYYSDFVIQDSSGTDGQTALFVYMGSRVSCSDGDTISDIYGTVNTYGGMRELDIGEAETPTIYTGGDALPAIVPLLLTGTEFATNYANYDCEIIKVIGTFDSPGATFTVNVGYPFTTQDLTPIVVYTRRDSPLVGGTVPSDVQEVIGVAAIYPSGTPPQEIWPIDIQPYAAPTVTPTPTPTPTPYGEASVHQQWSIYE
jgi:hypothetical protein